MIGAPIAITCGVVHTGAKITYDVVAALACLTIPIVHRIAMYDYLVARLEIGARSVGLTVLDVNFVAGEGYDANNVRQVIESALLKLST